METEAELEERYALSDQEQRSQIVARLAGATPTQVYLQGLHASHTGDAAGMASAHARMAALVARGGGARMYAERLEAFMHMGQWRSKPSDTLEFLTGSVGGGRLTFDDAPPAASIAATTSVQPGAELPSRLSEDDYSLAAFVTHMVKDKGVTEGIETYFGAQAYCEVLAMLEGIDNATPAATTTSATLLLCRARVLAGMLGGGARAHPLQLGGALDALAAAAGRAEGADAAQAQTQPGWQAACVNKMYPSAWGHGAGCVGGADALTEGQKDNLLAGVATFIEELTAMHGVPAAATAWLSLRVADAHLRLELLARGSASPPVLARWLSSAVSTVSGGRQLQPMLNEALVARLDDAHGLAGRSRSHQIPPAMRDVSGALHSGPDGVLKAMTESFDKLYGGETKLSDETLNQLENDVAAFELTRATEVDEAHGRPPDLAETEACVRALRSAAAPGGGALHGLLHPRTEARALAEAQLLAGCGDAQRWSDAFTQAGGDFQSLHSRVQLEFMDDNESRHAVGQPIVLVLGAKGVERAIVKLYELQPWVFHKEIGSEFDIGIDLEGLGATREVEIELMTEGGGNSSTLRKARGSASPPVLARWLSSAVSTVSGGRQLQPMLNEALVARLDDAHGVPDPRLDTGLLLPAPPPATQDWVYACVVDTLWAHATPEEAVAQGGALHGLLHPRTEARALAEAQLLAGCGDAQRWSDAFTQAGGDFQSLHSRVQLEFMDDNESRHAVGQPIVLVLGAKGVERAIVKLYELQPWVFHKEIGSEFDIGIDLEGLGATREVEIELMTEGGGNSSTLRKRPRSICSSWSPILNLARAVIRAALFSPELNRAGGSLSLPAIRRM
ncbi:hypothetical protein FOA52_007956 [Chlamydomonas sp. UWO 241]|nr:hypothetical protein FOA52_007956 [Chlamydomonas sp. UWO 241]